MIIIYILSYLLLYVATYYANKWIIVYRFECWSKHDANINLITSLAIVFTSLTYLVLLITDPRPPFKKDSDDN